MVYIISHFFTQNEYLLGKFKCYLEKFNAEDNIGLMNSDKCKRINKSKENRVKSFFRTFLVRVYMFDSCLLQLVNNCKLMHGRMYLSGLSLLAI